MADDSFLLVKPRVIGGVVSRQERLRSLSLSLLLALVLLLACDGGFALIIWALVKFAQDGDAEGVCSSRVTAGDNGFTANPEFYGLGIRLGIYLQWWASLIANLCLPGEWASLIVGYLVFTVALIVAILVLTFQHACAFTAEVIVIMFFYWGGYVGLVYSTDFLTNSIGGPSQGKRNEASTGLSLIFCIPTWTGIAFSTWFWLRLATTGEVDYAATPGGTFYFMFSRVSTDNIPASRFLVVLCFYFGISFILVPLFSYTWMIWRLLSILRRGWDAESAESIQDIQEDILRKKRAGNPKPVRKWAKWVFGGFCAIVLIYSMVATEMTLIWNSVSGIYSVNSTGQVIPLTLGLGLFINVVWKLRHWTPFNTSDRKGQTEDGSDENDDGMMEMNDELARSTAQQQLDGTWR